MQLDHLIENIWVWNTEKEEFQLRHVGIGDGKIQAIEKTPFTSAKGEKTEVWDGTDLYLLPGMIDAHTHMRDMDLSYKETFTSGSQAAVQGGVTTFFDMPNSQPPTITLEALAQKQESLQKQSYANYGMYFGTSPHLSLEELSRVEGVVGWKFYLNETTGNLLLQDWDRIEWFLANMKQDIIAVHSEGTEGIKKLYPLTRKYHKKLYWCHIARQDEVLYLKELKNKEREEGIDATLFGEVTLHHLLFSALEDATDQEEKIYRVKPALQSEADQQALWEALRQGVLDTFGTDHAPHHRVEKWEKGLYGFPSIDIMLPMLLTLAEENKLSWKQVIQMYSTKPAEIFGLSGRGKLEVGAKADMVIVQKNHRWIMHAENSPSLAQWTPYEGFVLNVRVHSTFVNGKLVYHLGNFFHPQSGTWIK